MFQNTVLRRIFGSKRDEVAGECRKLGNEKLNYLYSSLNVTRSDQSNKNRTGRTCNRYLEKRRITSFDGEARGKKAIWKTQA